MSMYSEKHLSFEYILLQFRLIFNYQKNSVVRDETNVFLVLSRYTGLALKHLQAAGVSSYEQLAPGVKWRKVSLVIYVRLAVFIVYRTLWYWAINIAAFKIDPCTRSIFHKRAQTNSKELVSYDKSMLTIVWKTP